jgi:hypothetical protein
MKRFNKVFRCFSFLTILLILGCKTGYKDLNLSVYQYQDTKNLVRFVYKASLLLKKEGLKSIEIFKNDKYYNHNEYYLYIYNLKGENIYHGGMNFLKNKNLFDVTDKDGKRITELILKAINNPNNPHGWVHYSWWKIGKFYPLPKSSCNFKVTTPNGKKYFIGAGINYPHEEKEFIRIIVDDAVNLINKNGHSALNIIADPTSEFNFREVRAFVFTKDDDVLISPVVNNSLFQIKLVNSTDEVGNKPFIKALKNLENNDNDWEVFMAKNKYQRNLIKKCLYIRKANLNGQQVFVAAITDLPQPPS